jgi:hypothetical protein
LQSRYAANNACVFKVNIFLRNLGLLQVARAKVLRVGNMDVDAVASAPSRAYMFAMTLVLIDPPSPFDTLETWQRHLADVRRLPDDTLLKAEMVEAAEEQIDKLKLARRGRGR